MERLFADKRFHATAVLVIAAGVLIAYSDTFHSVFQFDDIPQIVENEAIKNLGNLPEILKGQRGVTLATFALNYAVGGLNVLGYHVVNTAIHILNAILAYFFLFNTLRLSGKDEVWSKKVAAFSALIFALHPVQTQAVTYIVQRMESLASLFYLTAVLFFIKAASCETAVKRVVLYACVGLSYIFGFYSKEIAFTLPAVIFLYDFCFMGSGSLRAVFSRWPVYVMLSVLFVFFTVNTIVPLGGFNDLSKESAAAEVKAGIAGPVEAGMGVEGTSNMEPHGALPAKGASAGFGLTFISSREYLLTQFNVIIYYLTLMAVPVNQNLDYEFPVADGLFKTPQTGPGAILNIPIPPPVISLVIIIFIIAVATYLLARSFKGGPIEGRIIAFFVFWFFIIISPTSSFVPIADVIYEHRVYLPSLGFFTIAVICVYSLCGRLSKPKKA